MRTQLGTKHASGNTLLLVMVLTTVLSITLASYLVLVQYQNKAVMRSLAWNSSIPLSEAGIEEALTHINMDSLTNLASAGWTAVSGGYTKTGRR